MLYGLGATDTLGPAIAALPECFSQDLMDCLVRGTGLPKAQCATINAPYSGDQKTQDAIDNAINSLPVCTGPSMVPYVGLAFAVGALLGAMVMKR